MKRRVAILSLVVLASLMSSCGVQKHIGEGDKLLRQNVYDVRMADGSKPPKEIKEALKGMRQYTAQSPNPQFLGVRWGMRLYCLAGPEATSGIANYLHKKGNAPAVYKPEATYRTASQLQSLLESKGCCTSSVTFDTMNLSDPDMKVVYHIVPSPRYSIHKVSYEAETEDLRPLLIRWQEESLLKAGDFYDADIISS